MMPHSTGLQMISQKSRVRADVLAKPVIIDNEHEGDMHALDLCHVISPILAIVAPRRRCLLIFVVAKGLSMRDVLPYFADEIYR